MNMKKIMALLLAVAICVGMLAACGSDATYKVTVLDGQGNPYTSGVIVKFMQGTNQAAMQPVGENGVAEKKLPKGDYTVELVFTDDKTTGKYDTASAVLSAKERSLEITLYNGVIGQGTELFATSPITGEGKTYTAYGVAAGSTCVSLEKEERNYFLFTPTEAGTYKVSVNGEYAIGYYGAPHFVQAASAAEVTDNAFTFSVAESMIGKGDTGTSVYVIGIDGGKEAAECILTIENIGEPEYNVADEPWTEYKATHTPAPFKLEGNKELTYVDIMTGTAADSQVVYNESDGFYHFGAADGPVVYMHLGKKAPHVSLQTIIQGDGPMGGAPIRHYFFDEDGKFIKREDYTDLLSTYFENMDQDLGIYPLTQDLVYIVQNACSGWWDAESPDYIFQGCNPEIAWMFALCYVK